MTNTSYLAQSVEAARIAAAEKQMTPPPVPDLPFDATARFRAFQVILPRPAYFTQEWTARFIHCAIHVKDNHWHVLADPWATQAQVEASLNEMYIPF